MIRKALALAVCAVVGMLAAFFVATNDGQATGCKKNPTLPRCQPPTTTTPPPTTPPPTVPPPPFVCPDGKPPEENPVNPHDNCERPKPPPITTTPNPPTPTPVVPPPALNCSAGMTELSRTATQIVCGTVITKTVVKTRTKTKVVVKKVRGKTKFIEFCPKPRNGKRLTG